MIQFDKIIQNLLQENKRAHITIQKGIFLGQEEHLFKSKRVSLCQPISLPPIPLTISADEKLIFKKNNPFVIKAHRR